MRISDWSSDVCSSDLLQPLQQCLHRHAIRAAHLADGGRPHCSVVRRRLAGRPDGLGQLLYHHYGAGDPRSAVARLAHAPLPPGATNYSNLIGRAAARSEEHTSELQSLMRISYAVFCLKKTTKNT